MRKLGIALVMICLTVGIATCSAGSSSPGMPTPIITALPHVAEQNQVIRKLVDALQTNNADEARAVVVTEAWPQIDEWLTSHAAVSCESRFNPELFGASRILDFESKWSGSVTVYGKCGSSDNPSAIYSLHFDRIDLEKTSVGWKIADWEGITEEYE